MTTTNAPPTTELRLDLRAKPQHMCPSGRAFQEHYEYRTTWPLAEILHDKFFLPMREHLRRGDEITLCRYNGMSDSHVDDFALLEIATVRVIQSGRNKDRVPLAVIDHKYLTDETVPVAAYRIEVGKSGKTKLLRGETMVQEYGSKSEAEAAMAKLTLQDA